MSSLQVQEFEQRVIKNDTAISSLPEEMAMEPFDYPSKTPKNKLEVTLSEATRKFIENVLELEVLNN